MPRVGHLTETSEHRNFIQRSPGGPIAVWRAVGTVEVVVSGIGCPGVLPLRHAPQMCFQVHMI
jgi:hypothetical protein